MERLFTVGCLKSIIENEEVKNPIMQLIAYRKMNAIKISERYRLLISDGQNTTSFAVLAPNLNYMISSGKLGEYAIVRIKHHIIKSSYHYSKEIKKVMIIIDLDILVPGNNVGITIGNPIPIVHKSYHKLNKSRSPPNSMMPHLAQANVVDNLQRDVVVNNIIPIDQGQEMLDLAQANVVDNLQRDVVVNNIIPIDQGQEMFDLAQANVVDNNLQKDIAVNNIIPINQEQEMLDLAQVNVVDNNLQRDIAVDNIIPIDQEQEMLDLAQANVVDNNLPRDIVNNIIPIDQEQEMLDLTQVNVVDNNLQKDIAVNNIIPIDQEQEMLDLAQGNVVDNNLQRDIVDNNIIPIDQEREMLDLAQANVVDNNLQRDFILVNTPPIDPEREIEDHMLATINITSQQTHRTIMEYDKMLTTDSLIFIINNEEVKNPVMQILGIRKITAVKISVAKAVGTNERYRLLISDGQNSYSLAVLAPQLNDIISTGKLTEFAIVRIKHFIIKNSNDQKRKKIMVITNLDVLVPGDVVGLKIGDPKRIIDNSSHVVGFSSSTPADPFKPQSNSMVSHSTQTDVIDCRQTATDVENNDEEVASEDPTPDNLTGNNFLKSEYKQMLTTGSLKSMMNNEDINESIMQVLNIEKVDKNCWNKDRYRLLLSDGENSYSFFMLASQLNDMINSSALLKFDIIWITDHIISTLSRSGTNTKVMIIVDLVVLVSGKLVRFKIGDPKPIINSENEIDSSDPSTILVDNQILSKCFDMFPI